MTKNIKLFIIVFTLTFLVGLTVNVSFEKMGDFFYWNELASNPKLLTAQANQLAFEENLRELKPLRNGAIPELELQAKSAISLFLDNNGNERALFQKNSDGKVPIASLTKLMTAKVVLENYNLSENIKISKEAIRQEENFGKLRVGDTLSVEELLYPLLMESSNDAAFALTNDYRDMTGYRFVEMMNQEAVNLGLNSTFFINQSGLDSEETSRTNYSTAVDLAKLAKELLGDGLIWEILSTPTINLYGQTLESTNELLGKLSSIVGGKTGYTEKALGCFLLIVEAPKGRGYLINVVLGSPDRFGEMEKLISWVKGAYYW